VSVDHFIINYWARSTAPQLEAAFHSRKRLVWISASFGDRAWSIYMLYSSLLTLLSALHATLLDLCRLLVDLPFRQQIVGRITDPQLLQFWYKEFATHTPGFRAEAIAR